MHSIIKQLAAGSAGLTLALALISGGSPDVTWNSAAVPAGIAQSASDGIANGAQTGIANRAFANPQPNVSYGPQPSVSYGPQR